MQTSSMHTKFPWPDGVGSAQVSSQQVRVAPCNVYKSWLSLDPLCIAAHHTCFGGMQRKLVNDAWFSLRSFTMS